MIKLFKVINVNDNDLTKKQKDSIHKYMEVFDEVRGNDLCYKCWYDLDRLEEDYIDGGVDTIKALYKTLDEVGIQPDEMFIIDYSW